MAEKRIVLKIKTKIMAAVKSSRFPRIQLPHQILEELGITREDAGKNAYITLYSDNTLTIEKED